MFEKIANFCICWSSCGNDFMDFRSFFHNGPYAEFIYLEMADNCSCRPQPVVYVKPIELFLLILDFPLFWEHFLCHWGTSWVPWCYSKFTFLHKPWWKIIHKNHERSLFTEIYNLLEWQSPQAETISVT